MVYNNKGMRECWNWQTGTFEGRVVNTVRVQVPSLAPKFIFYKKVLTTHKINDRINLVVVTEHHKLDESK